MAACVYNLTFKNYKYMYIGKCSNSDGIGNWELGIGHIHLLHSISCTKSIGINGYTQETQQWTQISLKIKFQQLN